jgi:hypothetical protein
MANAQEALDRISDYLANRISLDAFENWSASFVHDVRACGDPTALDIAQLVRSILNTFDEDAMDDGLRKELAIAILPFQSALRVFPKIPVQSDTTYRREESQSNSPLGTSAKSDPALRLRAA